MPDPSPSDEQRAAETTFTRASLVSSDDVLAPVTIDSDLINPWGLAFAPTGLWVSDNHAGVGDHL
jgi:hypothetical protein